MFTLCSLRSLYYPSGFLFVYVPSFPRSPSPALVFVFVFVLVQPFHILVTPLRQDTQMRFLPSSSCHDAHADTTIVLLTRRMLLASVPSILSNRACCFPLSLHVVLFLLLMTSWDVPSHSSSVIFVVLLLLSTLFTHQTQTTNIR
jgi:hypothetical protein